MRRGRTTELAILVALVAMGVGVGLSAPRSTLRQANGQALAPHVVWRGAVTSAGGRVTLLITSHSSRPHLCRVLSLSPAIPTPDIPRTTPCRRGATRVTVDVGASTGHPLRLVVREAGWSPILLTIPIRVSPPSVPKSAPTASPHLSSPQVS